MCCNGTLMLAASPASLDPTGILSSLQSAQHVIEMFRRTLPEGFSRRLLDRLTNRLTKIIAEIRNLDPSQKCLVGGICG
jgi:hypothetical protein